MAYITANLQDIDSATGSQIQWQYYNAADSLTTIRGSGYFDPSATPLPNEAGNIQVNDLMVISGSEGTQYVSVTGTSPVTVDHYLTTSTLTLAANPVPTNTVDVTLFLDRLGQTVTLYLPELDVAGNSNAGLITYSGIPSAFRPRMNHELTGMAVRDTGTYTEAGTLILDTSGVITIGLTNASSTAFVEPTNFSATASNCGHQSIYLTYIVT